MRPALQRLLARPSSLEFLRFLVGTPGVDAPASRSRNCVRRKGVQGRGYSGIAVGVQLGQNGEPKELSDTHEGGDSLSASKSVLEVKPLVRAMRVGPLETILDKQKNSYGLWSKKTWTSEELELESNLDDPNPTRLLNRAEYQGDMELWAYLLDYRQRKYGATGISMFWNAILQRGIQVPTKGHLADKIWTSFLTAGLQGRVVLGHVCDYADELLNIHGRRWVKLYFHIVQHFLVKGSGAEAIRWHDRLQKHHPPGNKRFLELCKRVTSNNENMTALRTIYERSSHHNVYSKVIPGLCAQEDYKAALDWHFYFLRSGDFPQSSKTVEPLIHFLAIYDRPAAVRVTRSLVDAGVSFADALSSELRDNTKISREMMNLIHSKTFNVPVKSYNDNLGARWFATNWVSLDVAINAIHALGIQQIGPLSLQSLALREPDASSIVRRLEQFKDLGISIGTSVFSRAVENFARGQKEQYLKGLLLSDQHPDELEDQNLQESLLAEYARKKNWSQYRRTLEIQSIGSRSPEVERRNLMLRSLLTRGDIANIKENLLQMKQEGVPVKSKTIACILRCVLRPRQQGRRPMTFGGPGNDLEGSIELLQQILKSGSYVPVTYWREIIRRLGMLGKFQRLQQLCTDLATWYGPNATLKIQHRRFRVPLQVPTSHPLHPLKILFPASLQKAIVEWGFIHSLDAKHRHPRSASLIRREYPTTLTITSGISLLKQLSQRGVSIDGKSVRSAIFNRLVTYYGPGRSRKVYNRIAKARIGLTLEEVATQIDQALGGEYFRGVDIVTAVESVAATRLRKMHRRSTRGLAAPRDGRDLIYPVCITT